MVIRIIEEDRTIKLSVRDVTRKSSADLSDSSSVSSSLLFALRMGQDAHQVVQDSKKQEDETYSAEFSVSYETFVEVDSSSWKVQITGRADAVLQTDEGLLLDEYKSVSSFDHFNDIQDLPTSWVQQVQLYGFILASQGHAIETRLVLVALGTHKTKTFDFPIEDQQELIERKIREIIQEFSARKQQTRMKSQYAELLQFPFAAFRPGQQQLIDRISEILDGGGRYLYSAPTGMGKTAASLFPALQFALQRGGMKVFFATAKGTQQVIAGTTFQQLVAQNPGSIVPKGIILRAKEKMCPQDELLCGDGLCPLLVNYMKAEGSP
jgi:DNA excision repair protein ERCC-2